MYWSFKGADIVRGISSYYKKLFDFGAGISRYYQTVVHLFTTKRFRIHRVWGLLYLIQFAVVFGRELLGLHPIPVLYVTLPLTGIIQSVIATLTFTFLPKEDGKMQGYFHNTKAMSHDFVVENAYFAGLLLFQSLYVSFPLMRSHWAFAPVEVVFVFLPYHTVREFFPKTSFRNSINHGKSMYARVVKTFYVTAKHYSGYFVNYLCFLGILGSEPILHWALVRRLLILGGWGTTIAIFLQTLKFKKYISMTSAIILYVGSFPLFFLGYAALVVVAFEHVWLTALTAVGLAVNFGPRWSQVVWQLLVCGLLFYVRMSNTTLNEQESFFTSSYEIKE